MKNDFGKMLIRYFGLLVLLTAISSNVSAAPGDIDPTFGGGVGKLRFGFGFGHDYGRASVIQPDGRIVVAGNNEGQALVARYNPNGNLDATFDGDGIFLNSFGFAIEVYAVALQPDGKILVAGAANVDFFVVRLNPNGSIDTFFGTNGVAKTNITGYDYAFSLAIQADGKIVLAGEVDHLQNARIGVVRYNPNGTPDTSFDNDGVVVTNTNLSWSRGQSVAIQPDGKILVLSEAGIGNILAVRYLPNGSLDPSFDGDGISAENDSGVREAGSIIVQPDGKILAFGSWSGKFATVRYNPDGSVDATFGQGGVASTTLVISDGNAFANSMALQPDGKILVAGYRYLYNINDKDFVVVRYNSDGTPDTSFDGDGIVLTNLSPIADQAYSVGVQPDEKIVVAGNTYANGNYDLAAARYNADGSLDSSFGAGGVVITDAPGVGRATANGVAIHTDNKITVAGYSYDQSNLYHFTLLRFNESGGFDASFGSGGKVLTRIGAAHSEALAIAVQPDGKTVAVGYSVTSSDRYFFTIARYNVNGSLDTSFDGDGTAVIEMTGERHWATSVAIQPDGKIVVGGTYQFGHSAFSAFAAVRFNPDGSLDTTFDGDGIAINRIGSDQNVVNAMALDSNGNIVLAGYGYTNNKFTLALVRLLPNGSLDTGFGSGGTVFTLVGTRSSAANSLAIQNDNKIIAGGNYALANSGDTGFALTRYNFDGSLDTSFDGDGIVASDFGTREDNINSIRLQPDGKIIAAGIHSTVTATGNDFAVARYNPDGSLDSGWGTGGIAYTDFNNTFDTLRAVALDRFGRVVAVGEAFHLIGMARYKGDAEANITAAISGRVVNESGRGIPNARITLSNSQGEIRTVGTNPFGYYRFVGIPVGSGYVLNIGSKQIYTFAPSTLTLNLFEDYAQANFTGSMTAAAAAGSLR